MDKERIMKTYSFTIMVAALLATAVPVTSSWATVEAPTSGSGEWGQWSWTVDGSNSLSMAVYWQEGDGDTIFAITNGTTYIDLMSNFGKAFRTIVFSGNSATVNSTDSSTPPTLDLPGGTYTFAFKNTSTKEGITTQGNLYSTSYSWEYFDVKNPYYLITNATGDMQVSFYTNANEPSPVPVPGSALLLSTAMIGLASLRHHGKRID
jgi:hypothetical protein